MKSEIHRAFNLVSYNHREVKLKGRKIPKEPKDILNHTLLQARKNSRDQFAFSLSFASDWLTEVVAKLEFLINDKAKQNEYNPG